jgi:two-component system, LytTR family, response regulator AlgR
VPFSALLIDDEPLAVEALRRFCERDGRVRVVGEAIDGRVGLALAGALQPDVLFLDIGMPGLSGLDVAAGVAALPRKPLVVLVTAFDHFATQAFDLAVVDYVLKPLEPARFRRAVDRVDQLVGSAPSTPPPADSFWVPSRGGMVRIDADAIRRIDAERDYVRLSVSGRSFLLREPISAIEARLDPSRFVRIHRSAILRADTIVGLRHLGAGAWAAMDEAGQASRIGRSFLARVRERLGCTG